MRKGIIKKMATGANYSISAETTIVPVTQRRLPAKTGTLLTKAEPLPTKSRPRPAKARELPAKVGVGNEKAGAVTAKVETDGGKAGGVTNKARLVTAIFSINGKEVFTNSAVLKLESFASLRG